MDFNILQSASFCPNMKRRAGEAGEGPSNKVIFLVLVMFVTSFLMFWLKSNIYTGGEGGERVGEKSWHDSRGQAEELHVPRGKLLFVLDPIK